MAINIVLGSEQAVSNWGEDAIYKLQDSARQKLMRYKCVRIKYLMIILTILTFR